MAFSNHSGEINRPVLFFDGVCNLCNTSIQFVLRHEQNEELLFSPLQSEIAQRLLPSVPGDSDSLILYKNGKIFCLSNAALLVAKYLKSPYRFLAVFLIIPAFIRDPIYRFIARNRYRLFGKSSTCMLPDPSLASRFI
jgi:predicted DCC family thiol-disulfide oxidoreductase YuxK